MNAGTPHRAGHGAGAPFPAGGPVVGFDLDLTLIDTNPAIAASLATAARQAGVSLDIPALLRQLGPDLQELIETQVPPTTAARIAAGYRRIYNEQGLSLVRLLPGAREAIAAVAGHGGRVVVVTGQREDSSRRHLAHQSLPVATVVGSMGGMAKGDAMRAHGVTVYVGDQPTDMAAARAAGAVAVAVTTGNYRAAELPEADVVLESLLEFPGWLRGHLAEPAAPPGSYRSVETIG